MSSYGVLETGIRVKTSDVLIDEMEDEQRLLYGPNTNTSPESVLGQQNAIVGDKLAELWELAEAVYAAFDPDGATDTSFDHIAALTGSQRQPATQGKVTLSMNLDPGTTLNIGRVVSNSITGDRWVTDAAVSNATAFKGLFDVAATAEEFGAIPASAFTIDQIETPVSGWTAQAAIFNTAAEPYALSDGQTLEIQVDSGATQVVTFNTGDFASIGAATVSEISDVINDNTTGIEAIDGNVTLFLQSATDGPGSAIQIVGGTSNAVLQLPTDVASGLNQDDAETGSDIESTTSFRIRREEEIRSLGKTTVDAVRAAILAVPDVAQAFVWENTGLLTDSRGLPGKSIEAVVFGGDDTAVAQAIFDNKGGGVETHRDPGAQGRTVAINTSQGTPVDINFSRITEVRMYVEVDVTANLADFGGGNQTAGEQAVKDAIATLGDQQVIGQSVIIMQYRCTPFDVTGVVDVPSIKIEDTFPPTNTANIPFTSRQLATFDTSDIVVNVTSI